MLVIWLMASVTALIVGKVIRERAWDRAIDGAKVLANFKASEGSDDPEYRPDALKYRILKDLIKSGRVPTQRKPLCATFATIEEMDASVISLASARASHIFELFSSMKSGLDPSYLMDELEIYAEMSGKGLEPWGNEEDFDKFTIGTIAYHANYLFARYLAKKTVSNYRELIEMLMRLNGLEEQAGIKDWDFSDPETQHNLKLLADYAGIELPEVDELDLTAPYFLGDKNRLQVTLRSVTPAEPLPPGVYEVTNG